eukprot:7256107-Pyramimonas_sp.AAC.1
MRSHEQRTSAEGRGGQGDDVGRRLPARAAPRGQEPLDQGDQDSARAGSTTIDDRPTTRI